MKKRTTVLVSLLLLASCSGEGDPPSVSQEKIENPAAANDIVATPGQNPSHAEEHNAINNPFSKPEQDVGQVAANNPEEEFQDEDVVEENAGDGLAIQESDSGYLEWAAPEEVAYSNAEVIITDASGKRLERSFAPGEAIVVDESLPDGHYLWESVVTPEIDPYVREEMREVRESGNFEKEQALIARLREEGSLPTEEQARENRKSGSFFVKDGIATPISPTHADDEPQRDGG